MIDGSRASVAQSVNTMMVLLYWEIGEIICLNVLNNGKAKYGRRIVEEVAERLAETYGKGFDRATVFRMIQFYQAFPDREKIAALSQQLTWSHFLVLLPIKDALQRDFYAAMCRNEN